MTICIYTKIKFSDANATHILPRFLGSDWQSRDIACNEVQELFSRTIDVALEVALGDVRNLIHNFDVTRRAAIAAHGAPARDDSKPYAWATDKLRNLFPDVRWQGASPPCEADRFVDNMHLSPSIGGRAYFRSMLKAAFHLLGANSIDIALLPCFDPLRDFILDGVGNESSHIRWLSKAEPLPIPELGAFDHFIGIYSHGRTVEGIVQFFGGISHLVRLTSDYDGPDFCHAYQVNPLRDSMPSETRTLVVDPYHFPQFDDGYQSPGPEVWPVYGTIYSRLLENYVSVRLQASQVDKNA